MPGGPKGVFGSVVCEIRTSGIEIIDLFNIHIVYPVRRNYYQACRSCNYDLI